MNLGRTVFSQITEHLTAYEFQKCVDRYRSHSHFRGFSCLDQYLAMAFAQLTDADESHDWRIFADFARFIRHNPEYLA